MNTTTRKFGLMSSMLGAASFLVFTCCFIFIFMTQDLSIWTNLEEYTERIKSNNQLYKQIAQLCSIIFGISYLIVVNCFYEMVSPQQKILHRLSVSFAIIFVTLIGINYFLQLTAVHFNIQEGSLEGISKWVMFNPNSITLSIAMLGWTFMLGLSSLFAAGIFQEEGLSKTIRILFLLNAIFCILGGVGFMFKMVNVVNFTINIGMGGTLTILMIVLSKYFWQMEESF